MMLFWLVCAVLLVIAFAFVLPTALQRGGKSQRTIADERKLANIAIYRDQLSELEADLKNGIVSQEQYAQDREEIERRLLEDTAGASTTTRKAAAVPAPSRGTAYTIAFGLPLFAVLLYFLIGTPDGITGTPQVTEPPRAAAPSGERTQEQIEANVAKLAERLKANPADAEGWKMLARSYNRMSRFSEAAGAFAKATELQPNDADLWAEYAFASAMTNQQRFEGYPTELINRALKVDPENAKVMHLAGEAAFQAKDYVKAIQYWEKVLKKVPPDSDVAKLMAERINEAKNLAGNK